MNIEKKDPLREAIEILDKYIEQSVFHNEIYKDKDKDPHVKFALAESELSNRMFHSDFLPKYYTKNENGLYEYELSKSVGEDLFEGKYFYNSLGYLHNNKGPAVVTKNGKEMYLDYGVLHREDGPAVIFKDPNKDFQVYIHYIKNTLHRENGPAKEVWQNGELYKKSYYINGKLHREDGPAIEWADGQYIYAVDGKKHKEDGPAVRIKDPFKEGKFKEEYWVNGEQISAIAFKMSKMREKFFPKNNNENKQELK